LKGLIVNRFDSEGLQPTLSRGGVVVNVKGGMEGQAALLTDLIQEGVQIRSYAPIGSGIEQRLMEINREIV